MPPDTQSYCERRIEVLLYSLPDHQVSLDRFMYEYEKRFGEKLSSYYGHPKLVNLLEDMEDTVEVCLCVCVCIFVGSGVNTIGHSLIRGQI